MIIQEGRAKREQTPSLHQDFFMGLKMKIGIFFTAPLILFSRTGCKQAAESTSVSMRFDKRIKQIGIQQMKGMFLRDQFPRRTTFGKSTHHKKGERKWMESF